MPTRGQLVDAFGNLVSIEQHDYEDIVDRTPASYTIMRDGDTYWALPGFAGGTKYSGPDATIVIQAAINALVAGGEIFIKTGIYNLNGSITDAGQNNVHLIFEKGATLFVSDNMDAPAISLSGVSNWEISEVEIDGNSAGQSNANAVGIYAISCTGLKLNRFLINDTYDNGLTMRLCRDVDLSHFTVSFAGGRGIYLEGQDAPFEPILYGDITISDFLVKNCTGIGIQTWAQTKTHINTGTVRDCGENGIRLDTDQTYPAGSVGYGRHTISDVNVYSCGWETDESHLMNGIHIDDTFDVEVTNVNSFLNKGSGIAIEGTLGCKRIVVTGGSFANNSCLGGFGQVLLYKISNAVVSGINVLGDSTSNNGIDIMGVSNNIIVSEAILTGEFNRAILVDGGYTTVNLEIASCIIDSTTGTVNYGIYAMTGMENSSIHDCKILYPDYMGIRILGDADSGNNNKIYNNFVVTTSVDCLQIGGDADNNDVFGNTFITGGIGLNIADATCNSTFVHENNFVQCTDDIADSGTGTIFGNNLWKDGSYDNTPPA